MPVDFKTYPVIVFLEGEMFTQGNPGKYPAEDLAAEGLVVVSVHYRLNIFGMNKTLTESLNMLTNNYLLTFSRISFVGVPGSAW